MEKLATKHVSENTETIGRKTSFRKLGAGCTRDGSDSAIHRIVIREV